MRLIRFIDGDGHIHVGQEAGEGTAAVLEGDLFGELRLTNRRTRIASLLAPLIPADIICVGRNYRAATMEAAPDDRREEGAGRQSGEADHTLEVFLKPSTALQHPNEPILIPHFEGLDAQLDCEGELAVVIARDIRNINERDALDHVLGYTIANDVTARAFQTPTGPPLWMRGKGFDTFCPLGPALVTRDEIPDPQNLTVRTIINGQVVRDGHTSQMIRTVPQIIATLSRRMTLRQGAVILTGAPPVIDSRSPDVVNETIVEVDQIGRMTNPIRQSAAVAAHQVLFI